MGKPSQKKALHKRRKQEKKQERDRPFLALKEKISRFPPMYFEGGSADPKFVLAVRQAAKYVWANHDELLPRALVSAFYLAREYGFSFALRTLREAAVLSSGPQSPLEWEYGFFYALGRLLFKRMFDTDGKRFFPFHDVQIDIGKPVETAVRIRTTSLKTAKSPGGTVYYSSYQPTATFDGDERVIAFSTHAVHRICERTVVDWTTYDGFGDAFAVLNRCRHYEPCVLEDGGPAFAVYNTCVQGFLSHAIAVHTLGELDPGVNYVYRVGYCPVVFHDRFAIAKTLLTPGMDKTPEIGAMLRANVIKHSEKSKWYDRASALTFAGLKESGDWEALRLLHEHGVPQVFPWEGELFEPLR